jgi:hypothetical protein
MAAQTGLTCTAYYMTGGSFSSPTWTIMPAVQDLTIGRQRTEINASTRGSQFEKVLVGLKKMPISITFLRDDADATIQDALETAYEAGTDVVIGLADGAIATSGTRAVKIEGKILSFDHAEPLDGAATISMTFKPSATSTNDPAWVTTGS